MGWLLLRMPRLNGQPEHWQSISLNEAGPDSTVNNLRLRMPDGTWRHHGPQGAGDPLALQTYGWQTALWLRDPSVPPATPTPFTIISSFNTVHSPAATVTHVVDAVIGEYLTFVNNGFTAGAIKARDTPVWNGSSYDYPLTSAWNWSEMTLDITQDWLDAVAPGYTHIRVEFTFVGSPGNSHGVGPAEVRPGWDWEASTYELSPGGSLPATTTTYFIDLTVPDLWTITLIADAVPDPGMGNPSFPYAGPVNQFGVSTASARIVFLS